MKKYKLVIPKDGLTKGQLKYLAKECLPLGYIFENEGRVYCGDFPGNCPPFLREEIKNPMTFDEWYEKENYTTYITHTDLPENGIIKLKEQMRKCHEWTIENERLKHIDKDN